jgi:hypothetical protein
MLDQDIEADRQDECVFPGRFPELSRPHKISAPGAIAKEHQRFIDATRCARIKGASHDRAPTHKNLPFLPPASPQGRDPLSLVRNPKAMFRWVCAEHPPLEFGLFSRPHLMPEKSHDFHCR